VRGRIQARPASSAATPRRARPRPHLTKNGCTANAATRPAKAVPHALCMGHHPASRRACPRGCQSAAILALPLGHHAGLRARDRALTDGFLAVNLSVFRLDQSILIFPRRVHLILCIRAVARRDAVRRAVHEPHLPQMYAYLSFVCSITLHVHMLCGCLHRSTGAGNSRGRIGKRQR
jgi:hypothetical protein